MQGGAAGNSSAIFDVTSPAGAGIVQSDVLTLPLTTLAVSASAPVTIKITMYDTPSSAVNEAAANVLSTVTVTSAVSVADGLTAAITANALVADVAALNGAVSAPFTKFLNPASVTANLGNIKFTLAANAVTATGVAVTALNQVMDTAATKSKLVVTGDLSFIGDTDAATTATKLTFGGVNADVATPASSKVSSAKLTTLTGITLGGAGNDVAVTANAAMNAGDYSLAFTPTKITDAQFGASAVSAALGSITRNGATAQVPYLSTAAGLNQKLILVNRGAADTTYSITFTPETTLGVVAAAGAKATGTLKAKETLVLKAADVVTLTGGTRTAATFVALSPAGNIDAATQTVVTDPASVSFGSNDTVNLTVK
jgi:hypothetical protein